MASAFPSGSLPALPLVLGWPFVIIMTAQACGEAIEVPEIVFVPPDFQSEKIPQSG